jgi:hypothetical protein
VKGKDGSGSNLLNISMGPHLSDALLSSAIIQVSWAFYPHTHLNYSRTQLEVGRAPAQAQLFHSISKAQAQSRLKHNLPI